MIEMMKTRRVAIAGNGGPMFSGVAPLLGDLRERARAISIRNQERFLEEACFTSTAATSGPQSCLDFSTIAGMKRKMEELGTFLPPTFYDEPYPVFGRIPSSFVGLQFRETPYPKKQARTHYKKRINKKWRKRYGFIADVSVDTGNAFLIQGHTMVAYPGTFARIMAAIRNFKNC